MTDGTNILKLGSLMVLVALIFKEWILGSVLIMIFVIVFCIDIYKECQYEMNIKKRKKELENLNKQIRLLKTKLKNPELEKKDKQTFEDTIMQLKEQRKKII